MNPKAFGLLDSIMAQPHIWIVCCVPTLWLSNYAIQALIKHTTRLAVRKKYGHDPINETRRVDKLFSEVVQAGEWTGALERTIVLLLVLLDQYQAVAWVMAANGFIGQSVSKVENDPDASDAVIKQEIYLIGTFVSFAIAIVGGLLMANWLEWRGAAMTIGRAK